MSKELEIHVPIQPLDGWRFIVHDMLPPNTLLVSTDVLAALKDWLHGIEVDCYD